MTDNTATTPTVGQRLTGSTGNAIQDGTMRGAIVALVNIAIGFLVLNVSMSDQEIALLYAAVNPGLLVLFGIFDAVRAR
jgi:hypothetical protein